VRSSVADSGLFEKLDSSWGLAPGPSPRSCWLTFRVDFAFRSALHRAAADLFFAEVAQRMVGAFEGRCATLYGPSSLARGGAAGAAGACGARPKPAAAEGQCAPATAGAGGGEPPFERGREGARGRR